MPPGPRPPAPAPGQRVTAAQLYASMDANVASGKLDRAETLAKEVLARQPEDERAHVVLARVLAARGKVDAAVRQLDRLVAQHPEYSLAMGFLAELWKQKGSRARASHLAQRAVSTGDDAAAAHEVLGREALEHAQVDQARQCFQRALQAEPQRASAWRGMAASLRAAGDRDAAAQALHHAVAAEPVNAEAWLELVRVELEGNAVAEAQRDVLLALKRHPRHPELLKAAHQVRALETTTTVPMAAEIAMVRDELYSGETSAALQRLEKLEKLHRTTRRLRFARSEWMALTVAAGEVSNQVVSAMQLCKDYPEAWEPRNILGYLLIRRSPLRNLRQAMVHCEEAWSMSGGDPHAGATLVLAYLESGRTLQAHALADQLRLLGGGVARRLQSILAPAR